MDLKNKINNKIKSFSDKQYLDGYIKNEFLTDDGTANIFIKLNDKNELFDTRTIDNQIDLNKDIYDFIEDKSAMLDNNVLINFHIVGLNLTSKEEGKVKHLIKEHYAIKLYEKQREYDMHKSSIIKLLLLGLLFLAIYGLLYLYTKLEFCKTVVSFLFSFSLWEALDAFINAFKNAKYERESITQNMLMEISFDKKTKE